MKDGWFDHYERLEAEHPDWSADKLCDHAMMAMVEKGRERADQMKEMRKYQGGKP